MLLGIARSGVYRPPRPANDNGLALMQRIDELFTAWPFLGSRRMTTMLKAEGLQVNRKRVQRLMRKMGIAALGPKPNTTKPAPGPAKPGVGGRHHVFAHRPWLSLSRRRHRLGEPCGSGVAVVEHDGRLVLRGGSGRGAGDVRHAGDFQHDRHVAQQIGIDLVASRSRTSSLSRRTPASKARAAWSSSCFFQA
ncbi:transposase [Bradyrhizobium sp. 173]|nr:transposase [Bradyrhizobium sp. 173]